ncbi:MAG: hypothetical protein UT90_C0005G0006 [Parcubacteria group bacterium GW2011_GWA1_40_21]|nr:MAG: hypothetical protein UT80_C0052G0007 [Parcubacteria group bacterium GW2011_GWC1_40_13]KKR53699.1 MAG: hypothetical protein UT90_C0005G0006 [Parcubacteria group bacterium GW2011_GWA1_40_21]
MKVIIDKNGDVVYRQGLKTLIVNMNTKVDYEIFKAAASFSQTIHYFLSSRGIMNCATITLFAATLAFFSCVFVRELKTYLITIAKVSGSVAGIFIALLIYRSRLWKWKIL